MLSREVIKFSVHFIPIMCEIPHQILQTNPRHRERKKQNTDCHMTSKVEQAVLSSVKLGNYRFNLYIV